MASLGATVQQQLAQISATIATVAVNAADACYEPTPQRRLRLNRPDLRPMAAAPTAPLYQTLPANAPPPSPGGGGGAPAGAAGWPIDGRSPDGLSA